MSTPTELQETFKLFDRDNDGYLTPRELGEAMRAMAQHPTELEIQELTKKPEGTIDDGTLHFFRGIYRREPTDTTFRLL